MVFLDFGQILSFDLCKILTLLILSFLTIFTNIKKYIIDLVGVILSIKINNKYKYLILKVI